ncbi:retrovirus-related pol polyprotein from transposon TNT 1-94 [Tanacetum coccineum]
MYEYMFQSKISLLAAAQPYSDNYYQAQKSQRSNATSSSTRPSASTRHKGKEIAKPVTPQSESLFEEDSDPEQAQRDKDMQKNLALLAKYFKWLYKPTNNNLRTSSNSRNKTKDTTPRYNNDNQSGQLGNQRTMIVVGTMETVGSPVVQQTGIQCFNCKGFGHYEKECRKPKLVKDYTYHKEKMMMCKQAEQGVPLQAEQADWLAGTDEEIDEQELEVHYSFMEKIQEVLPEESKCADERATLANLIANLTLDTEENKMILKQLKIANTSLTQELEECKTNLDDTSRALGEATSFLNQKHDELVKKSLLTKSQFEGQLKEKSKVISDLKVKEEKDIDKMIEMDKQLKFLNEIVYTRNQSIQTIHMLAPKCSTYNGRPTFANPRFSPNREETMTFANESRSKLNKNYVKPYDYTKQNSLYEIFKAPSLEYLYQLERAKEVRKTMWRKPFVRTKPNIAKNVAFLPVSKSISKSRQVFNDMTFNINQFREIVDQAWFKHTSDYFRVPTAKDMEVLIKTLLMPLSIKTQNDSFRFEHELKTEMHEDYEYVKSLEKEVDELESEKADFSNIYDLLLEECVSKDVTCSYLHSLSDLNAYAELQCLYLHKVKECECLAQKLSKQTESVNKEVHNKLLKSFAKLENHSISLELALQQCKEQMKNNSVCKENESNVFRKEREQYHEIQDLKAQMQDKNISISELKKLIEKCKGKSVETQFDKPSVVQQPNAQRIPKPSVLGKPTPFSNSPEMRSFQTATSCPTCKKCLYSANHDECVLEYLSRLNPHASIQNKDAKSHKTTKRYMPVEKSSASKKPERQIPTGHRFSNKKTTTVPEKIMNPRSCLRWQLTGRILKTVGLRWVPTGKLFNSCTNKVESEPTHGSNVDIHHSHACKQTRGLSAGLVLHQMTSDHNRSELRIQDHSNEQSSLKLVPKVVP